METTLVVNALGNLAKRRVTRITNQRVTAMYKGTPRPPYKSGAFYPVVIHTVGGHRFLNGEWVEDKRVQVYLQDYDPQKESGHIMYPSMEDLQKDFAI
jgi:hypothetical protein